MTKRGDNAMGDVTMNVVTKITDDGLHAAEPERPVSSEYVEELRAFVAKQDRIAAEERAEAISEKGLGARMIARVRSMKWQDAIFSAGEVVFMVGLIPSVLGPDKPSAITSISTGIMLLGFLAVHRSFKLWVAFGLTLVTATMWFILAAQVILS